MYLEQQGKRLIIREGQSQVWIEPWGENSLRVRMTKEPRMDENDWALEEPVKETESSITFTTIDVTDPWYKGKSMPSTI
jgi:alpha-D-xyloside xylohydrolase